MFVSVVLLENHIPLHFNNPIWQRIRYILRPNWLKFTMTIENESKMSQQNVIIDLPEDVTVFDHLQLKLFNNNFVLFSLQRRHLNKMKW